MLVFRLLTSFSTAKIFLKRTNNNLAIKSNPDCQAMSTNQRQMKRLRKKIVAADESDMSELKPRMIVISELVSRHAPLSSQTNENPKEKLSSLKTGRSLCDQEPFNTQKSTQCLVLDLCLKRLITYRIWECRKLLVCRKDRRKTQTTHIRRLCETLRS